MTNRTLRVRGGLRVHRTLGLRGDSNHSAQRLGSSLGVPPSPLAPSPFLFFSRGGFELEWGGKKAGRASCKETGSGRNEIQNPIWCLRSYRYGMRPAHGVHPRHPPRTFPLGLLAPRCLGSLRFLASIACGLSGSGRHLFGGRKESSPQLRAPPRSGRLESSVPC